MALNMNRCAHCAWLIDRLVGAVVRYFVSQTPPAQDAPAFLDHATLTLSGAVASLDLQALAEWPGFWIYGIGLELCGYGIAVLLAFYFAFVYFLGR